MKPFLFYAAPNELPLKASDDTQQWRRENEKVGGLLSKDGKHPLPATMRLKITAIRDASFLANPELYERVVSFNNKNNWTWNSRIVHAPYQYKPSRVTWYNCRKACHKKAAWFIKKRWSTIPLLAGTSGLYYSGCESLFEKPPRFFTISNQRWSASTQYCWYIRSVLKVLVRQYRCLTESRQVANRQSIYRKESFWVICSWFLFFQVKIVWWIGQLPFHVGDLN